jgi:hypothetical protein
MASCDKTQYSTLPSPRQYLRCLRRRDFLPALEDVRTLSAKTKEGELGRIYHIPIPKQPDLPISYNIAPSQPEHTGDPVQTQDQATIFRPAPLGTDPALGA